MLHIVKPAALGAQRASVSVNWQVGSPEPNPSQYSRKAIRAEQHNVPLETIRHALLRDARGNPSSPLGCALDIIAGQS